MDLPRGVQHPRTHDVLPDAGFRRIRGSHEAPMSNPVLVGYDATSSDRVPVTLGVAAARCVRSPLMIVCIYGTAPARDLLGAAQVAEDRVADASETLDDVVRELEASGIRVEFRGLGKVHPTRALHATARAEKAGLLVVGSPRRGNGGTPTAGLHSRAPDAGHALPRRGRPIRLGGGRRSQDDRRGLRRQRGGARGSARRPCAS